MKAPTAEDLEINIPNQRSAFMEAFRKDVSADKTADKTAIKTEPTALKTEDKPIETPVITDPALKTAPADKTAPKTEPAVLKDEDLKDLDKVSGLSDSFKAQLRATAQRNKELEAQLATASTVKPEELTALQTERDEAKRIAEERDAKLRKIAYRYHPEYIAQVEEPAKQVGTELITILKQSGVADADIVKFTQVLNAPPTVQRYEMVDKITDKLPRSLQGIITAKVLEMDKIYAKMAEVANKDDAGLKEYTAELDRLNKAKLTPEKIEREAAVKVAISDPKWEHLQQTPITGLTDDALVNAKKYNAEVLTLRDKATRLANGNVANGEFADFVVKATAYDAMSRQLAFYKAQAAAKDAEIAKLVKATPGIKTNGQAPNTGNTKSLADIFAMTSKEVAGMLSRVS